MSSSRDAPPPKGRPSPSADRTSPAEAFRRDIDKALAEGATPDDLVLRLTLRDATQLVRDPKVPLADIRYEAGVMRFMGVLVEKGGLNASQLSLKEP